MLPFIMLGLGIVILLLLIIWLRVPTFIALILVAIGLGFAQGMGTAATMKSVVGGVGGTLGGLAIILGLGAILGGILVESGAAKRIADVLIGRFGKKYITWAMLLTGFIIGIPLFYTVGFVMLIPLIFVVARQLNLPAVYIGISTVAALSVTHGFLPPHPGPTLIAGIYEADMGLTLLYGLILAVPSAIIAGPLFARFLRKLPDTYNPALIPPLEEKAESDMPPFGLSILIALTPVILMGVAAVIKLTVAEEGDLYTVANFVGDPIIALLIATLVAMVSLGLRNGRTMKDLGETTQTAVKGIAMIMLIIGAGGALKQVLIDSGLSNQITDVFQENNWSPIMVAWTIAALLRISLGSATVAAQTAAGIVAPLVAVGTVSPELLVLATGAGSLTCSQVNDTGFWLFKEYFNLSILDTFKSWTVMETIVSVCGLLGCLLLDQWI